MSEEEGQRADADDDLVGPKEKPKIVRILTVLAYALSVSMAAILLSIYYVFVWDGHPTLARKGPVSSPLQSGNMEIYVDMLKENSYFRNNASEIAANLSIADGYVNETNRLKDDGMSNLDNECAECRANITDARGTNDTGITNPVDVDHHREHPQRIIEIDVPKEIVLLDVPYEPTAIPVLEATTPSPIATTDVSSEWSSDYKAPNFTDPLIMRNPLIKKLILKNGLD